jgi:uncharacterized protein (TIGR03083 family)
MRLWSGVVVRRAIEPPDFEAAMALPAPGGSDRFDWVRRAGADLADALAATPEDTPVWTFAGRPGTVRFWARRQAHEVVIHRYDAELAAGWSGTFDPHLAADGVDEYFELLVLHPAARGIQGQGETVHFHCTDHDVDWIAELTPDGLTVRSHAAAADVSVRGTADAILPAVWNRIGPEDPRLNIVGDRELLARWRRLTSF